MPEQRVLLPPQHQSDEVVLLLELLVGLVLGARADDHRVLSLRRRLLFVDVVYLPEIFAKSADLFPVLPSFLV